MARLPALDPTVYYFPCHFVGDPTPVPAAPRNLLGLAGVVDKLRITFDGTPQPGAKQGTFALEKP